MTQARLTDEEIARLPTGNQHSDEPTVIEWQVVKGVAIQHGVPDWTAHVDSSLTIDENIDIVRQRSVDPRAGPTLRELPYGPR